MPYIADQGRRALLDPKENPQTKGELNFLVTQAAISYIMSRHRFYGEKVGYTLLSEAIGALRDAADELQRRLLAPYEDRARDKAGDVIPDWLLEAVGAQAPKPHEPYWTDRPDFRYGSGKDPREIMEGPGPWHPENTNNW